MRGFAAGKEKKIANRYLIAEKDLRVVSTRFTWKYYGSTVLCEHRKLNIKRFRVNKVSGQNFQRISYHNKHLPKILRQSFHSCSLNFTSQTLTHPLKDQALLNDFGKQPSSVEKYSFK